MTNDDDLLSAAVDATLTASRALLGVVARSVAPALEVVTLPQFRVLVLLSNNGPTRVGALAEQVGVVASTFSRSVDRMEAGGWIVRTHSRDNRREVLVELTPAGRELVATVTERRRRELREILLRLSPEERDALALALAIFNSAAGEPSVEELLVLGL